MAFWNTKPKPQLPDWDMAKKITKAEAQNPALPLGWYIYKDQSTWYGLRPNEALTGLERSYQKSNPKDLEEWLGKPIPEEAPQPKGASLEEIVAQATQAWDENRQPPAEQPARESNQSKTPHRMRGNGILVRFTDSELVQLRKRVRQSGKNQSAFIREAALTGKIVKEEANPQQSPDSAEIHALWAEMGRVGGMLKMIIKPNEGLRELYPQEFLEVVKAIRYLERSSKRLKTLEAKLNGNHQASNQ